MDCSSPSSSWPGARYTNLESANYCAERQHLSPARGTIFDRSGRQLAITTEAASVYAIPNLMEDRGASAQAIAEILDLRDNGHTPCDHVRHLIAKHAADLQQRINDLQAIQTDLRHLAIVAATEPHTGDDATHCHILETARRAST